MPTPHTHRHNLRVSPLFRRSAPTYDCFPIQAVVQAADAWAEMVTAARSRLLNNVQAMTRQGVNMHRQLVER